MRSVSKVSVLCIALLCVGGFIGHALAAPAQQKSTEVEALEKQLAAVKAKHEAQELANRQEEERIRLQISKLNHTRKGWFAHSAAKYNRDHGYVEEAQPPKPPKIDPCDPQRLYIRADSIDNYLYGVTPAAKAKGASVSWLDDKRNDQRTLSVAGMVSYVLFRDLCPNPPKGGGSYASGWVVAPFVYANGNFTQPRTKKEESTLKSGVEFQFEVSRGLPFLNDFPLRQVFTAAPYYQTDFRGLAKIVGVNGYWDVFDGRAHLGGYYPDNPYFGWFVQLRGELDVRRVTDAGITGLDPTDYAWLGGTARLSMFLWPSDPNVPDFIRNRISLIAGFDRFYDTRSTLEVRKWTGTVKYKLNPEGYSSIAYEYSEGTDKDSLVYAHRHLIKLLYAL